MKRIMVLSLLFFYFSFCNAQEIPYSSGKAQWKADSLGNHRIAVVYNGKDAVAKTVVAWRRRDENPQDKRIIVQDGKTLQKIGNVKTGEINNESGEIYFEPVSGKGIYYIYYMPYKNEGRSNYPRGVYLKPEKTASDAWLATISEKLEENTIATEMQSIDTLNSFYPMELIATAKETTSLITKSKYQDFLVFPEDRLYPIKMTSHIPYRWIEHGPATTVTGNADKGEYYAFQLGVLALDSISGMEISFTDLKGADGKSIPANLVSCINNNGTNYDGSSLHKKVSISKNKVQAFWCGVDVPVDIPAGLYKGSCLITAKDRAARSVPIQITITNNIADKGGINEPWKQTRLKWLNSTLAQENTVIAPYTPLTIDKNTIGLLGRTIQLNEDGLPAQVQTFFTPEMTGYTDHPNKLFTAPMHFEFIGADGKALSWKSNGIEYTKKEAGTVQWKAVNTAGALQMNISASLEFDGFASYTVQVIAGSDIDIQDIRLQMAFSKEAATYMMGLGQKGGYCPANFSWKWDVAHKNQDGAWVGAVNAGMQFSLRDEKYTRPLNTNFYLQKPLLLPKSWGNDSLGGINITQQGNEVLVNNYSGKRTMKKGDTLYYNFTLLITPFHPVNTDFQWANRFYHRYNEIDSIRATGATLINIHHATPINPWINYPFIEYKKMKAYIDEAHSKGLKVKIYNTVRELSDHAYETFPMRSLGHEIYSPGKGGGYSWLQEHVGSDYIAAWFVPEIKDAAIVNSGMSRWHNYYVEGMNWLVQNVGIDGIYLDDVAFDRITMKRIKRVLTLDQHPGIIDLHSANQYNKNDGFNNSANLYMEHFPYLNRLWFGEYFDYEANSPDFFLTEVSGIPFGLMGEMLQGGGNPWRGMVYGMTNRMPWSDNADPSKIWKVWDEFGMKGSSMIGYWSPNCPVKTSDDHVLATVYQKEKTALVAIGSWATDSVTVHPAG